MTPWKLASVSQHRLLEPQTTEESPSQETKQSQERTLSLTLSLERTLSLTLSLERTLSTTLSLERTLSQTLCLERTLSPTPSLERTLSTTLSLEKTLSPTLSLERTLSPTLSLESDTQPGENTQSDTQSGVNTQSDTQPGENTESDTQPGENTQSDTKPGENTQSGENANPTEALTLVELSDNTEEDNVSVHLVQTVQLLPRDNSFVQVTADGGHSTCPMLLECDDSIEETIGLRITDTLFQPWETCLDSLRLLRKGLESGMSHLR